MQSLLETINIRGLLVAIVLTLSTVASAQSVAPHDSRFEVRIGVYEPDASANANTSADTGHAAITGFGASFYLSDEPRLTDAEVESASLKMEHGHAVIRVLLTPEGGEMLASMTRDNIGRPLAIMVDSKVVAAPIISSEIQDGIVAINGNFSSREAARIALKIVGGVAPSQ